MQKRDYLTQMAALVRENPNITVRELTKELSFADGKSIYYWLDQGNYQGLGDFKRMVLSENQGVVDGIKINQAGKDLFLLQIPIRSWEYSQKESNRYFYFFNSAPSSRGIFALIVGADSYSPWFSKGDLIVISTTIPLTQEGWVLLKQGRSYKIARNMQNSIVDPHTLSVYRRKSFEVVGKIIFQQRSW